MPMFKTNPSKEIADRVSKKRSKKHHMMFKSKSKSKKSVPNFFKKMSKPEMNMDETEDMNMD
jgi:hypothetical protein